MRVVPRNDGPRILFYRIHGQKWAEDPEGIGTSAEMVAQLQALTDEAQAALAAQHAAQQAARAATLRLRTAMGKLRRSGSSIIMQIRNKARTSGKSVYFQSWIPAPEEPSPIPPPGMPEEITFELGTTGQLALYWKCKNPRGAVGTAYWVYRRIGWSGAFEMIGIAGKKRFLDQTLPAGSKSVTYRIRGVRGNTVGPWAQFDICLGTSGQRMGSTNADDRMFLPPPGAATAA